MTAEATSLAQSPGDRLVINVDFVWEGTVLRNGRTFDSGTALASFGDDVPRLSDDFPLILGDAIANYRAALDHLTWALVKRGGEGLTVKKARRVQFPMHNNAADFEKQKAERTPGIPDEPHRALMKRYHPYRRGAGPQGIRWIRTLADTDKHRVVPVADPGNQTVHPRPIDVAYSFRSFRD